ncbi:polyamine-modulated factor 1-binding protein 1-like isoform X4 [Chiloscyllium plagiosum]|uniref:polyamine-modulated factor 1-binding protein 1-like isoform X4 n=1 Tax=Chiloscyllium plagiosum TaxID=36176 RepID=UPI001CB7E663|nr:polyamine-modulated factor 1-binding protein 1-like isoform X4 [Chiloscyllium plagiosum]
MDIGKQDPSARCLVTDRMKVQAGSCGQDAAGEDVGVGLRRDLELLRAAGKESPLPSPAGVRQSMKRLSSELQGLYEERLKQLGNKDESKGALKMKLRILQSYVNDLSDQNKVLVQTVEDLEREANEKIASLDAKLWRADQASYEQWLRCKATKEETDYLRKQNLDIKIDPSTLIGAIQQDEIMQKFDFPSLHLRSIPLEQVVKPALRCSTIKKSEETSKSHLESLKSQFIAGDQMVEKPPEDLKEVLSDSRLSKAELDGKDHVIYSMDQQNKKIEAHCRTAERNKPSVDCKAQNKVQKKKGTIIDLKDQIKQLQQQYNETVEENGRLRARLEAWMITAQSEQDILSNEVFCKEDIIHKLRMKQLAQDEKCKIVEEQVAQCEETIKHLQIESSSLNSAQELNDRTITHKKQIISELQQENDTLKQKLKETLCKANESEEQVNTLSLEINMLKIKLMEKTDLAQNLEKQIVKQHEYLTRAKETLKDTKKAAGNKIHQKENKLCALQKQLVEAQTQYSACYEELLHREKLMQKLREEAMQLTDQISQHSQDISKLNTEKQEIELQMAVIAEKHRTAQQEVINRDQIILKLKTDLKTAQEKYTGSQDELGVQQAEINRLHEKLEDLQNEIRNQKHVRNEQENHLSQAEKSIQEFAHQREMLMQEIQANKNNIAQLQNDLDIAKQSYDIDLERWSQKNVLLQKELDSTILELQDSLGKVQECKTITVQLKEDLEKANHLHREAASRVVQHQDVIQKQNDENLHLREQIDRLNDEIIESHNQAKVFESTIDLYKQKYQANTDRIQDLEKLVQNFEEESKYSSNQMFELNDSVHNLKDEMVTLRHRYEEKCSQIETCEEMIDQLSDELNASQQNLHKNKDHSAQCEQLIDILKDEVQKMQREITDQKDTIQQLQSDLTQYQINHGHSNEEYNVQTRQMEYLQKELETVKNVCNEKISEVEKYEQTVFKLRTEIAKSSDQRQSYIDEVESLEKTLQTLQLSGAASEHKHKLELVQLQQQITQLENDLTDSQRVCNQKNQEIWKRDDLLQKRETDLLQSQENLKEKVEELKAFDNLAKDLKAGMQELQNHKKQIDKENAALRTEIQQLNQELRDTHQQFREKVQELASQEQKLILMESNLQATEKHLNDQIAEIVRQEQRQHKLRTELKTLKEHLETTKEEVNKHKQIEEELKHELNMKKQQEQQNFQEILKHQHDNQKVEFELTIAKDQVRVLQQQVQEYEERLKELSVQLNQALKKNKENLKDLVTKDEQLIMHEKEMAVLCEKLEENMEELEAQKQALEAVQRDNNQFHEESELMLSNVNKWITEQGKANETLGAKIKEQNQLVSHLTADKVLLQETIDSLSQELKKIKTELEEKKNDTEQIWALQNHSANQQILLNQLRGLLEDQEHEHESLIAKKLATIEDMHNKLKTNIESIQLLNEQLNTLSKVNLKLKQELEKEQIRCHQLELQSEVFQQTICSLRSQLKDQQYLDHPPSQQVSLPEGTILSDPAKLLNGSQGLEQKPNRVFSMESVEDLTREDLEKSVNTDPMIPDKSYWIQRVGELSAQLQENTEYWTDKMNELTKQIEHVISSSTKK